MVTVQTMLRNPDIRAGADTFIDAAKRDGVTLDATAIRARAIVNGLTPEQASLNAAIILERMRQRNAKPKG